MLATSSSMRTTESPNVVECSRSLDCSSEMNVAWLRMIAVCSVSCFWRAISKRVCSSMSRWMFCASSSGLCCAASSDSLLMTIRGGWSRFLCAHSLTVEVSVTHGSTLIDSFSPSRWSVSTTFRSTCCVASAIASFTEESGGSENFQLRPWCMKTARHSMDFTRSGDVESADWARCESGLLSALLSALCEGALCAGGGAQLLLCAGAAGACVDADEAEAYFGSSGT
mmetsp:Transcript_48065/g.126943  ORF Transcript_48065/g.126943 Transcript_48065/m.126943 type:complete len:226 (-) Transcript_48065:4-681(-)